MFLCVFHGTVQRLLLQRHEGVHQHLISTHHRARTITIGRNKSVTLEMGPRQGHHRFDTIERTSGEEYLVKCDIEDHPVVNNVGFLTTSGKNNAGVYVNLRCYAASLDGGCSVQQVGITKSTPGG